MLRTPTGTFSLIRSLTLIPFPHPCPRLHKSSPAVQSVDCSLGSCTPEVGISRFWLHGCWLHGCAQRRAARRYGEPHNAEPHNVSWLPCALSRDPVFARPYASVVHHLLQIGGKQRVRLVGRVAATCFMATSPSPGGLPLGSCKLTVPSDCPKSPAAVLHTEQLSTSKYLVKT